MFITNDSNLSIKLKLVYHKVYIIKGFICSKIFENILLTILETFPFTFGFASVVRPHVDSQRLTHHQKRKMNCVKSVYIVDE